MSHKKRHEEHEEHIDETWLIPYADLLTLLLALFIILFASSTIDAKKFDSIMHSLNSAFNGGQAPFATSNLIPINQDANFVKNNPKDQTSPESTESQLAATLKKEEKDLEELKESMDAYIKENNMSGQLATKLDNEKLMITISDRTLFDSGSATVNQAGLALAVSMSDLLSRYPGYQVEVAGHTDNVPIRRQDFETNWDLSAKRSVNFMKLLLNNSKINPASYRSVGFGEYRPVGTNDTAEGRAQNRRVEVSILRSIKASDEIEK